MSQFQFVMRSGPNPGKVYPVDGNEVSIGRDSTNAIAINDAEVSRKHARMELRGASYVIQDLGSTNGTFVNGNRTTGIQVLNPNDIVSFGEGIVLMYEAISDPNATMLSSSKPPKTAAAIQRPVAAPAPAPVVAPAPAPAPAYSGQVPAGPVQAPVAAPAKKKGSGKIILIIILVLVVCLILGCVAALLWIDADKTGARWCQYLPWLAQMLGGVCQ
jgi:pSer/pThr/pTyr-binding forkhead associated (FHA) protein